MKKMSLMGIVFVISFTQPVPYYETKPQKLDENQVIVYSEKKESKEITAHVNIHIPTDIPTPIPTATPEPTAVPTQKSPQPTAVRAQPSPKPINTDYKTMICTRFGKYCADALVIAQHESGFNPNAHSQTNDHGLMQINAYWQRDKFNNLSELYDAQRNIDIAWQIFVEWGYSWKAWSTCKFLVRCY